MRNSFSQFQHVLRVALVALPLLLLLLLNGRTVSLLRPAGPAPSQSRLSAASHATVVRQRVSLEAAAPLAAYVAPAVALGWLPATLPTQWASRQLRRAIAAAPLLAETHIAQGCRQRVLHGVLSPQAP